MPTGLELEHEEVRIARGPRSGLPIIVAVHSRRLGNAAGGCRMWQYDTWQRGLHDALRLSEAMTYKSALADLPLGGGKSVIPLAPGQALTPQQRRDAMLDLGDVVDSFDGRYGVGVDVGTTAEDMLVARERTPHAYCLPASAGGTGDPSESTALGVLGAIVATCEARFGQPDLAGRRCCVIGLGQVGGRLARKLAAAGATLLLSDVDPVKQTLARELGAAWIEPASAIQTPCDILVPAALGGIFTAEIVPRLACQAIVGPANNQLADGQVADLLASQGTLWAPDWVVNAGGLIYGAIVDILGGDPDEAEQRVQNIADTLRAVLAQAERNGITPYLAAQRLAHKRLTERSSTSEQ